MARVKIPLMEQRGGQAERLRFAEARLMYAGRLKRRYLEDRFGISPAQQSKDMEAYRREVSTTNFEYNRQSWSYHPNPGFAPQLFEPAPDAFLGYLVADPEYVGCAGHVTMPPRLQRTAPAELIRAFVLTIEERHQVLCSWQPADKEDFELAFLVPHALGLDDDGIFVRAFHVERERYMSIPLFQVYEILSTSPLTMDHGQDIAWHTCVTMRVGVHPSVKPGPARMLAAQLGITDRPKADLESIFPSEMEASVSEVRTSYVEWRVRIAMVDQVLRKFGLGAYAGTAPRYILLNIEDVYGTR